MKSPHVIAFLSLFWLVFCGFFVILRLGGLTDYAPLIALMALNLSICYAFLWAGKVKR